MEDVICWVGGRLIKEVSSRSSRLSSIIDRNIIDSYLYLLSAVENRGHGIEIASMGRGHRGRGDGGCYLVGGGTINE